jgi:hypothetical protein
MLSGCGVDDDTSSSAEDTPAVTLSVSSLSPADGATGVAIDTTLVATLSQAIDCDAVPSDPMVLVDGALKTVSGSINCSGATLSFAPAASLAYGASYTATLKAGISESSGAALASSTSWSFTTEADTTAPTVTGVTPAEGAIDVAHTMTISAGFDETLDCSTVTTSSFTLSDSGSGSVSGSVDCSAGGTSFTPATELAYSTTYTATLTTALSDSAGNNLASAYSWSFTTAAETTPPTVSGVTPADGATDVARDTNVSATFDEDIFASTVDNASFSLTGDNAVSGTVSFDGTTNVATFTPQSDLGLLTTYTATLTTDITDLAGNALAGDYNWSFTTADGSWGTAEQIETDDLGDASSPQIAFDAGGNAIAVWQQFDGAIYSIWANRYVPSTGWGAAELLEADDASGHHALAPQIGLDASGNAIAVWRQTDGTAYSAWANRYVAGTGWGGAELLEASSESVGGPQIALDSSGNAIATWYQNDGLRTNIWANRYDTATGWGTAELIEANDSGNAIAPQVALNTEGNAMVAWAHHDGSVYSVWATPYETGTGWGTPELLESDNAGNASLPQIAFDATSNAIAVWMQSDGTVNSIWANRYVPGIGWGTAELLESDNETGHDAGSPQIAFDGNGNALAVWMQFDGTVYSIWSNRYIAASGWGTPELLETDNGGDALTPQVTLDANGNAGAVWYQSDGSIDSIWANRYAAGSGWGTAQLLESDNLTGHHAAFPTIAADADGNMIAVWQQNDDTLTNIWANRFE